MAKKAFVRIQSEITINVTMGLQNMDVTNPDAHIPDRLKVSPVWPKLTVMIRKGAHWYPSEIAEWNTVKSLQANGILTIGEFSDTCDEENVASAKTKLNANIADAEKKINSVKSSLAEAAK